MNKSDYFNLTTSNGTEPSTPAIVILTKPVKNKGEFGYTFDIARLSSCDLARLDNAVLSLVDYIISQSSAAG